MGRSFESVRQGVNQIADRWARSSRFLREDDQKYGEKLAKLAKIHSSEAFIGCDDALEAAVFSVLIEIIKHQENPGCSSETPDNEYPRDGVLSLKYWT
jgi:asparagine synthetase B (glutamine-hydrolysing)